LFEVENGERPRFGQCSVQRRLPVLQQPEGLVADGLGWHQPQQQAVVAAQQMRVDQRDALGRQPGLSATGWDAEAKIWHVGREAFDAVVRHSPMPEIIGNRGKCQAGIPEFMALVQVEAHAVERAPLVLLGNEGSHGATSRAYGVCLKTMPSRPRRGAPSLQAAAYTTRGPSCAGSMPSTWLVSTFPPSGVLSPRMPL